MVLLCFSVGWYCTFVTVRPLTSHEVPTTPKYCSYDSPLLESCNYKMTQCYIYFRNSRTKQSYHFSLSIRRIGFVFPLKDKRLNCKTKKQCADGTCIP